MEEWFHIAAHYSVLVINAMALVIIMAGTVEAFFRGLRVLAAPSTEYEKRDVWLRYARWLVAGLTFQLAADIIETSITTSWDAVGRLAAIAVIRTFLNYFLEKDLEHAADAERHEATTADA
jgi:uncharacterized membrane protein